MGEPLAPQPPCPHNYASIGESYARFRSSIANALKRPTRPSTTQSQRRPVEHALSESVGHRSIPRLCLPNHHSQTPKRPTRRTRASPAASGMDAPCDLHSWDASPQASPQLHPELQLFVPDSPAWSESDTEGEAHSSSVSNFASDSVLRRSLSLVSFSTPSTSSVSAPRRMSTEATDSRGLGSDLPLEHTPGSPRNDSNGVGMRHARSLKARRAKATTAESRACQPFKPESGASQTRRPSFDDEALASSPQAVAGVGLPRAGTRNLTEFPASELLAHSLSQALYTLAPPEHPRSRAYLTLLRRAVVEAVAEAKARTRGGGYFDERHYLACAEQARRAMASSKAPAPGPAAYPTLSAVCDAAGKPGNEDRLFVVHDAVAYLCPDKGAGEEEPCTLLGVLDGHGGSDTAQYCRMMLPHHIVESEHFPGDIPEALRCGFRTMQQRLVARYGRTHSSSGTTATVAVLHRQRIHVANVGDSHAVVVTEGECGSTAATLTARHHITDEEEQQAVRAQSQRQPVEHALSESVGHRSTSSPVIPRLCLPNHHSQTPKRPTRRTRASPAASGMDAPCDLHSWDASPQASPQLHPELQLFVPDSPAWSESDTEGEAHSSSVSNFAPDSVLRRSLSLVSFSTPSTSSVSAPRRMSTEATGSRGLGSDLPLEHTPGSPRNDSNGVGMRHARSLKARRAKATTAESRACQPFKPESGASQGVLRVEGVCQVSRNLGLAAVEAQGHEPHVVTHDVAEGDQMLVVASDGLWDFVRPSEVARSTSRFHSTTFAVAQQLLEDALAAGTKDNCCVVVVTLR